MIVIEWNKYRNPYSAGKPIKSEKMFFGRDEIFEKAYAQLEQNPKDPIVLYGQRRMGKTSVLHHMPRRLNRLAGQERYTTVLLDLQGFSLRGSDDFWEDMVGYIHLKLQYDYQLPTLDLPLSEGKHKVYLINDFLPMVQGAIGERRLLLMFDESLLLEEVVAQEKLPRSIFDELRQLMHNDFQISFIYSLAAPVSTLLPEFQEMFKDALTLHVTYFCQKVARALTIPTLHKPFVTRSFFAGSRNPSRKSLALKF
jgi:AAA+ ATPase superfamily predicted ATPase